MDIKFNLHGGSGGYGRLGFGYFTTSWKLPKSNSINPTQSVTTNKTNLYPTQKDAILLHFKRKGLEVETHPMTRSPCSASCRRSSPGTKWRWRCGSAGAPTRRSRKCRSTARVEFLQSYGAIEILIRSARRKSLGDSLCSQCSKMVGLANSPPSDVSSALASTAAERTIAVTNAKRRGKRAHIFGLCPSLVPPLLCPVM